MESTDPDRSEHRSVVSVFDLTDPTDMSSGFEFLDQEVVQLDAPPFLARRIVLQLGRCIVASHSVTLRARCRTRVHDEFVAFTVLAPDAQARLDGVPMPIDQVLVSEPGSEGELVVTEGYRSFVFLVPPDELHAHSRRRGEVEGFPMPRGSEWRAAGPQGIESLVNLGLRLTEVALQDPKIFDGSPAFDAVDLEVLEAILSVDGRQVDSKPGRRDRARRDYSRVIALAEDRAKTSWGERLSIADLCEAAKVSERTLQVAFRDVLEMTPVAFLIRRRLHWARLSLRAASPSATVTQIALEWGFWHFGEFARLYRECFGELPSATLRRP